MPSIHHRLSWPIVFFALGTAACPSMDPTNTDGLDAGYSDAGNSTSDAGSIDAGAESLTYAFESEAEVALGVNMADLAYKLVYTLTPPPMAMTPCPSSTPTESGYQVRGGCTDDSGATYEGTVDIDYTVHEGTPKVVEYTFDFHDYVVTSTAISATLDGLVLSTQTEADCGLPIPTLRTDALSLSIEGPAIENFGGLFPGAGENVALVLSNYFYGLQGSCADPQLEARGHVDVLEGGTLGTGTFELTSMASLGSECYEPNSGTIVLEGGQRVTVSYDGLSSCDDCVDYESTDGASGALCWP